MLDLISAYENYLTKVKKASANTVFSYMRDIRQYSEWLRSSENLDVMEASQLNINAYLTYLQEQGKSGATVSRCLASLKNFYGYVVSTGFLESSPVAAEIHVEKMIFRNVYTPAPISVELEGTKTLEGATIAGNQFAFSLYEADADFKKGDKIETVKNGADGSVVFTKLTYTAADIGEHY